MAEQQGGQQDSGLGPLWITIALFLAGWAAWYYGHGYISAFVFKIKYFEAQFISIFVPSFSSAADYLKTAGTDAVTWDQLVQVCEQVGQYLRYPVAAILVVFAIILYTRDIKNHYCRTYDMNSLRAAEVGNWPQIRPVAGLNLVKQDISIGPWSMSVQPRQFARKYNLLKEDKDNPNNIVFLKGKPIGKTMIIDRLAAAKLFLLQMGPYWRGPEALPIHARALFAVFAARANHDVAAATDLLIQIAGSAAEKKLDFSGADALLAKYKASKAVQKATQRHGYVLTVMATMIEQARGDGVLATADFLWLKPLDRPLWYVLNNVGRQTTYTEVAGPMSHWYAEQEFGRPLFMPSVIEAVNGLEEAIKEILFKLDSSDEDQDYMPADNADEAAA